MKILEQNPPNIDDIKRIFPHYKNHKPVFSYGNTIYNPFKIKLTPDLERHEQVHSERQGEYPEVWWYRYLTDKEFRLEEELVAYGEQLKFAKNNGVRGKLYDWAKENMAQALSGELYGNLISYGEAESKIRNYVKNR